MSVVTIFAADVVDFRFFLVICEIFFGKCEIFLKFLVFSDDKGPLALVGTAGRVRAISNATNLSNALGLVSISRQSSGR